MINGIFKEITTFLPETDRKDAWFFFEQPYVDCNHACSAYKFIPFCTYKSTTVDQLTNIVSINLIVGFFYCCVAIQ